jgi:hypothetical protein
MVRRGQSEHKPTYEELETQLILLMIMHKDRKVIHHEDLLKIGTKKFYIDIKKDIPTKTVTLRLGNIGDEL